MKKIVLLLILAFGISSAFGQTKLSFEKENLFSKSTKDKKYMAFYFSAGFVTAAPDLNKYIRPGAGVSAAFSYKSPLATSTHFGLLGGVEFTFNPVKSVPDSLQKSMLDSFSTISKNVMMVMLNTGGLLSFSLGRRMLFELDASAGFDLSFGNNAILYQSVDAKDSKLSFGFQVTTGAALHYAIQPNVMAVFLRVDKKWVVETTSSFLKVNAGIQLMSF